MAVYYVSSGAGSDLANGTSALTPWRTFPFAIPQLQPGDTLYLLDNFAAAIHSDAFTVPSGTLGNPITIAGYPGAGVVLSPGNQNGIKLTTGAPSYLIFKDFVLDMTGATTPEGIYSNAGHDCIFDGVTVRNGGGIAVAWGGASFNHTFRRGVIEDIAVDPVNILTINKAYACYWVSAGHILEDSLIQRINGYGVHAYDTDANDIDDCIVRRCLFIDTGMSGGTSFAILHARGKRFRAYSNIIVRGRGGIRAFTDSEDFEGDFNTIVGTAGEGLSAQFYLNSPKFRGNISVGNVDDVQDHGGTSGAMVQSNNHFTADGDPLFQDEANDDYRLTAPSPCVDAGVTVAHVTTDIFGATRPSGAAYDQGAHELGATGGGSGPGSGGSGGSGGGSGGSGGAGGGGGGSGSSTLRTEFYSDEVMQCPDSWYGGLKEARLLHAGDAERPLSDPLTGAIQPATLKIRLDDSDGRFRERFADPFERYWCDQLTHAMTSRPNRAALGNAFDTFSGFPLAQFNDLRVVDLTLVDALTRGMLTEEERVPWREVGEGFLHLLDNISERLDRKQAEPILLGRFTRTDPAVEPATPAAFPVIPIYLGIETIAGKQRHVWVVAGHACKSVTMQVDGVTTPEGSVWLIATQANWLSTFGAHYIDKMSVHGNLRRYALIYGDFGASVPDACAQGDKQLLALVEGVEDSAVGTGTLLTDYYQQYKHLVVNYVANPAHLGYQSGAYLTAPTGFRDNQVISTVYEPSFDEASTIGALRLPGGLQGAIGLGLSGRGAQTAQVLAELNINGFVRFGQPQRFQMGLVTLHPTQAAKDAAPVYSDVFEIVKDSFGTDVQHPQHRNHLDYRGDYRHETGVHVTVDFERDDIEAANYKQTLRFEREYRFIPGRTQMAHLAQLELQTLVHPPRMIRLDQTIGDTDDDNWLAYKNSGDYVKVVHFDAVGGRVERLHQIITPKIRCSARRSSATALDVEDLIGFDAPVST